MKILLPEGSSMSARDIVYAYGRDHQFDVLDPSRFCQLRYSSMVRRCYRCPSFWRQPQAYLDFLLDRLRSEEYDVLLPTHEQVFLLSRCRDQIKNLVGLAVPDFETLDQLQSKAGFSRLLSELDMPYPHTRIVRRVEDLLCHQNFPAYVKVDYSTAGNGVQRVDSSSDLKQLAERLASESVWQDQAEVLIQEVASGVQCTALALFQHGRMVSGLTFQIRDPGIGGWGMNGETVSHPSVLDHLQNLGRHVGFHGALFVDYFFDPQTNKISFIEANPRFGTALFPKLCGLPFDELFLKLSLDQPLPDFEASPWRAKNGVRFHQTFLMLISAAKSGANRRQLARRLIDAISNRGFFDSSIETITRPREDWMSLIPAFAVTSLLMAKPSASHWLVRKTLSNYTLPVEGAAAIRALAVPKAADQSPTSEPIEASL